MGLQIPNTVPTLQLTCRTDKGGDTKTGCPTLGPHFESKEHTMNRITKATAGLGTAAVVLLGMTGTALADTGTPAVSSPTASPTAAPHGKTLAAIQALAATAIANRLSSLSVSINAVNNNTVITPADKTTLLATLNGDVTGLTALGVTIAGDTTAKQAASDYATVFTTYRVYALALPQVRFAAAADDMTVTVLPKLTDAQSKLAALLAGADSGKNTPQVQAWMADLGTQITAVGTETNGLSATVLAYTPAQWDANHALLSPARASLAISRNDIKTARGDISNVMNALK
jgi:hypothetical protein